MNARPCISSPCLQGIQSGGGEWLHSHLARQKQVKWKGKKTWLIHRVFLHVSCYWIKEVFLIKKGFFLQQSIFIYPDQLLPNKEQICDLHQGCQKLPASFHRPDLTLCTHCCSFFQGCAAIELYPYIFIPLASITAEKKKRRLGMIRELVKDNRHKTNHTYLCAHYPCFVVSVLYSLHAESCHYLMGNSSKKWWAVLLQCTYTMSLPASDFSIAVVLVK